MSDIQNVGTWQIRVQDAQEHVRRYTRSRADDAIFAYSAHNQYPGSGTPHIDVQHLFAPTLLSVPMRNLRTYHSLVDVLPSLNETLKHLDAEIGLPSEESSLISVDENGLEAAAAAAFAIPDNNRPYGVQLTTLSKILHHKRPGILPIWDR